MDTGVVTNMATSMVTNMATSVVTGVNGELLWWVRLSECLVG